MKKSIGMIEYRSIAKAIESTNAMLKSANVELILSNPVCPGKYITLINGEVGAVESAMKVGKAVGGIFVVDDYIIPNVSEKIFPALSGTTSLDVIGSIGVIETMSAVSSIIAADIAVKAANVELIEIRMARGLGGKGFMTMTGELSSVRSAVESCEDKLKESGCIIAAVIIASPTKEVIASLL
ncbi:MAG: BMC domain-containing protein [Eubacteriales bacterium]